MILSGTALAEKIEAEVRERITTSHTIPKLAVILAGADPASEIYVARKRAAAERVGAAYELYTEKNPTTESLIARVKALNADNTVHGILIQLPLPAGIDTDAVIAAMDPHKDVDGFHPENIAAFLENRADAHMPVLLRAVQLLLLETNESLAGKRAVILGKSDVFLFPMAHLLELLGMDVSWVKPEQFHNQNETQLADVLIVALGSPKMITSDLVKDGAIVIDIGINRLPNGKVVGDVDVESVATRAAWFTPTPGGVGPVTIGSVFLTLLELADVR